MRAYAGRYGEDVEAWGIAGMLHDFDYEMHPRAPHHPMKGAEILLARGVPTATSSTPSSPTPTTPGCRASAALTAPSTRATSCPASCTPVALVRPGRVITGLEPASVRKKLKDKAFARTVNRDDVYRGAEELGVELDAHIAFVVAGARPPSPQRSDSARG